MNSRKLASAAVIIACGLGAAGCQNKKSTATVDPVPPPAVDAGAAGGGLYGPTPVSVEPAPVPGMVTPAPTPTASGSTYVVKKGDTLMSIARAHYGSAARFRDIAAANGLSDPNKIKVGQTLILP